MNSERGSAESEPTPELSIEDKAIQNARDIYSHAAQVHRNSNGDEIDKLLEDSSVDSAEEAKKAAEKGFVSRTVQLLERSELDEDMKLGILARAYEHWADILEQEGVLQRAGNRRHDLVLDQELRIECVSSAITLRLGANLLVMKD